MNPSTCPAPGCGKPISKRLLMCLPDWRRLPTDIQKRVYAAYKAGDVRAWVAVRTEAIEAVAAVTRRDWSSSGALLVLFCALVVGCKEKEAKELQGWEKPRPSASYALQFWRKSPYDSRLHENWKAGDKADPRFKPSAPISAWYSSDTKALSR